MQLQKTFSGKFNLLMWFDWVISVRSQAILHTDPSKIYN